MHSTKKAKLSQNPSSMQSTDVDTLSPFEKLPNEILLTIFSYFTKQDAARMSGMSCRLYGISRDPRLLKSLPFASLDYEVPLDIKFLDRKRKDAKTENNFEVSQAIIALVVLQDGKIVSGSEVGIKIWDLTKSTKFGLLRILPNSFGVTTLAKLPDGRIVSGSNDGTIAVWDLTMSEGLECVEKVQRNTECISALAISPDGTKIVAGSNKGTIVIWNLKLPLGSESAIRIYSFPYAIIRALAILPNGRIVCGSGNGYMFIWDLTMPSGSELITKTLICHSHTATIAIALSPGGDRIVVGFGSHHMILKLTSTEELEPVETYRNIYDRISTLVILPDKRIVSGYLSGDVVIWDLTNLESKQILTVKQRYMKFLQITAFATTLEGDLISGDENGNITLHRFRELMPEVQSRLAMNNS